MYQLFTCNIIIIYIITLDIVLLVFVFVFYCFKTELDPWTIFGIKKSLRKIIIFAKLE